MQNFEGMRWHDVIGVFSVQTEIISEILLIQKMWWYGYFLIFGQRFLLMVSCSIIPLFVFYKMSAARVGIANPFYRPNPYIVPQRLYSHEKMSPYSHSHYSPYKSAVKNDSPMLDHGKQLYASKNTKLHAARFQPTQKESPQLKRKNINLIENPFYRKNLIPATNDSNSFDDSYRSQAPQPRNLKIYESKRIEQRMENNYVKMPSLKTIPSEREKQNKPTSKYLSSQLKIKLKSQAELPPPIQSAQSISCYQSQGGLVTLGRLGNSNEQRASIEARSSIIPDRILVRGTTFYLQTII